MPVATKEAPPTVEERFWAKVRKSDGCWVWLGEISHNGYGRFSLTHRKHVQAHRFAYERSVGPIPVGLVIDHLCRTRNCVNPVHLTTVTIGENVRRGIGPAVAGARMRAKTHCPSGHPYDAENTRLYQGRRYCRACRRNRSAGKAVAA